MSAVISRRELLGQLGGVAVLFSMQGVTTSDAWGAAATGLPGSLQTNRQLDAWIRIDANGHVTVCTGKVELGQGILTALLQIVCEELDVSPQRITLVSGDTDRTPDEGTTSGSYSVENAGSALRYAGAEVRGLLLELAAQRWSVTKDRLTVSDGVITAPDGRRVTYGELAASVNLQREATASVAPKSPFNYALVGKSMPRVDIPAKVKGEAIFLQDIKLPNMLHGRIVRPASRGAKLLSVDEAALRQTPGLVSGMVNGLANGLVSVVRDGNFLGVIADGEYRAVKLRERLTALAKWSDGPALPAPATLHEHLRTSPTQNAVISERSGALPDGAQRLSATYRRPYVAHASIGPSCAIAQFDNQRVTVWTHSQSVFLLRASIARTLGMDVKAVHCIHVQGSGCYGQNGADDVALDAVLLARAVPGKPVRLQWMRDDEFMWEPYSPAMSMDCSAALKDGRIVDWQFEVWSNSHTTRPADPPGVNLQAAWDLAKPLDPVPNRISLSPTGAGDRNAIPLYEFPRQRVVHHLIDPMPIRTSALRTLGATANVWAIESFMDELAMQTKADPVAFRLAHMKDPRARAVIETVARRADWQGNARSSRDKAGQLRGRGMGFARYKNQQTYVAVVADVLVNPDTGAVQVTQLCAAADAGLIINPDGLLNQIEGGMLQATSWTLKESVRFDERGIRTRDWASYPIITMREVPHVDVQLINRPDQPAMGSGEASCGPAAAAVGNAVANAIGKRCRDLPLTPERVKALLRG